MQRGSYFWYSIQMMGIQTEKRIPFQGIRNTIYDDIPIPVKYIPELHTLM